MRRRAARRQCCASACQRCRRSASYTSDAFQSKELRKGTTSRGPGGRGFKWESTDEIFKKLEEEINELKEAIKSKNDSEIKNEFGDIYFTLLNLSNFLKINPESALQKTNMKFLDRFSIVEEHAGDNIKKQTPKDFQRLWQIAKQKLKRKNS